MANVNNPHGFQWVGVTASGAPASLSLFAKPASDANAIYAGDLVQKVAVSQADPDGGPIPLPGVGRWAATKLVLGASLNHGAANKATSHYVIDAVDAVFEAQSDDSTNITVAGHVGKNASPTTTAGDDVTGQSKMCVDASTIVAGNALELRLTDLYRSVTNGEGPFAIFECIILKHANAQGSLGV